MRNREHAHQQLIDHISHAAGLVATLHVDISRGLTPPTGEIDRARSEFLAHMGNVLERAKPFLHRPDMRSAIIGMLSAYDNWEDCFSTVNSASIPISPHKPRAVPLVPDQE